MKCNNADGTALKYSYKCVCPGCIARKVVTKFTAPDGTFYQEQHVAFYGEHSHCLDASTEYVPPNSTVSQFREYMGGRLPYTRTKRPRHAT